MHYMTLSFTHKNTDLDVREKLSFADEDRLRDILHRIHIHENINEVIVLSTCNRVEIITSVKECASTLKYIFGQLEAVSGVSSDILEGRADAYENNSAIHHLFSVVSSLDSLVIGETQIVGQLKDAYRLACEGGFCGQKLSRAMHHAFRCAAHVRTQTQISKSPVSVSSVAVSKAEELLGSLKGVEALVIGAGEMSTLAAKHLLAHGASIVLINRTPANAYALAKTLEGDVRVEPISLLKEYINRTPIIFSATGSYEPIINDSMIEYQSFQRYFFDIAVPRDIDITNKDNVKAYAVDDLKEIVTKNMALREDQAQKAYMIVSRSTKEFFKWLQALSVDPLIKEIREKAKTCALNEVAKASKKGYIPKGSEDAVVRVVHQVFNSFLHLPTKNLKAAADQPEAENIVRAIQYFFNIRDEDEKYSDKHTCEYHMENHA
ncbi:MAG: glutamyl-tRNA reductase [Campylobacteraceae bacterium]|nr:glutamyl-tRNA reductase [Campylobacteraceae bacterium]